jgi:hypothetical protein
MPILGVIASSTRQGQGPTDTGAMFPIFATTVTSTAASITFSNIPSTYTHLQIRWVGRVSVAQTFDNMSMRINGDTGNNYSLAYLLGDRTNDGANAFGGQSSVLVGRLTAASAGAGYFGTGIIDILDYKNTNKNKIVRVLSGADIGSAGTVYILGGGRFNTATITSLTIIPDSASNFVTNTSFALYGIL